MGPLQHRNGQTLLDVTMFTDVHGNGYKIKHNRFEIWVTAYQQPIHRPTASRVRAQAV